jgi:Na+/melibiose symporter-like transporter
MSLNQGDQALFTPREGTYLVAVTNAIAGLCSTQLVKHVGRKTLVVYGHLLMTLFHCLVGYYSTQPGFDNYMLVMLLGFIFAY